MAEIRLNEFVESLAGRPERVPNTTMVRGYVGRSEKAGYIRLYFDPTLRRWVDVPEKGVLHQQDDPQSRLGACFLWIDAGAELTVPEAEAAARERPSKLMEGSVADTFLGLADPHSGNGPIAATWTCQGTTPNGAEAATCSATTPQTQEFQAIVRACCSATTPQTEVSFGAELGRDAAVNIPAFGGLTPWALPNRICVTPRSIGAED